MYLPVENTSTYEEKNSQKRGAKKSKNGVRGNVPIGQALERTSEKSLDFQIEEGVKVRKAKSDPDVTVRMRGSRELFRTGTLSSGPICGPVKGGGKRLTRLKAQDGKVLLLKAVQKRAIL